MSKSSVVSNIVSVMVNYSQSLMIQMICISLLYLVYKINFRQKQAYFWLHLEKEIQEKNASKYTA